MKPKDFDFRIWDNTEKRYLNEIELHKLVTRNKMESIVIG